MTFTKSVCSNEAIMLSTKLNSVRGVHAMRRSFYSLINQNRLANNNLGTLDITKYQRINKKCMSSHLHLKCLLSVTPVSASKCININIAIRHLSTDTMLEELEQSVKSSITESPLQQVPVQNSPISGVVDSIPDWQIVEAARKMLLQIHEVSGLPWWASIALSAILVRTTMTLPFSVLQQYNTAKLRNLEPEMTEIVNRLKMEANLACSRGEPEKNVRWRYNALVKREYRELMVRNNCHWAKSIVVIIIQIPVWISFSVATRNLCFMRPHHDIAAQNIFMELMVGGFGWVPNLAVPDPYFILPVMFGLSNLMLMEINELLRVNPAKEWEKKLNIFLKGFTVVGVAIASYLPAAVSVYWLTSSMYGIMQFLLLTSPRIRRLLRIPITTAELPHPYRYMYENLRSKLKLQS